MACLFVLMLVGGGGQGLQVVDGCAYEATADSGGGVTGGTPLPSLQRILRLRLS
jgi:hypothetical protein